MKLRIHDNSLRFRLTQGEVLRLRESGRVEAEVRIEPDRALRYSVYSSPAAERIAVEYSADSLAVVLPPAVVLTWAASDQVSISVSGRVRVLIEKDFQCLHGPDRWDPDAWPNPLANQQSA
jgi:hypothetical protein